MDASEQVFGTLVPVRNCAFYICKDTTHMQPQWLSEPKKGCCFSKPLHKCILFYFLHCVLHVKTGLPQNDIKAPEGRVDGPLGVCLPSKQSSCLGNDSGQLCSGLVKSTYRSLQRVSAERAKGHNTVGDCGNDCSPRSSVVYLSSLKDQCTLISHCPYMLAFYMEVFERTSNLSFWLIIGPNRPKASEVKGPGPV